MIRIALGEPLPLDMAGLRPRGHAIECRIYAEDAHRGFAPSPGRITALRLPEGPGVRNDMGVETGSVVPIDYDPMLGKLIVHGADRSAAVARLARALRGYEIAGVDTTLPLFRALCTEPDFARGDFDVQWLDRRLSEGMLKPQAPTPSEIWLGAVGLAQAESSSLPGSAEEPASLWKEEARRDALRS
jgi:acetyl-CoA carboxylase, biotin carboxylase subunit